MDRFSDLPPELREMIWKMAIEGLNLRTLSGNTQRGYAHFFGVFPWQEGGNVDHIAINTFESLHYHGYRLVPPGRELTAWATAWDENNPSIYRVDCPSGLWLACRESHTLIAKEFVKRPTELAHTKSVTARAVSAEWTYLFPISQFLPDGHSSPNFGPTWHAPFFTHENDLHVLRFRDLAYIRPAIQPPPWEAGGYRSSRFHAAIEYEPSWAAMFDNENRKPEIKGLVNLVR
jgi:hypothetical protein